MFTVVATPTSTVIATLPSQTKTNAVGSANLARCYALLSSVQMWHVGHIQFARSLQHTHTHALSLPCALLRWTDPGERPLSKAEKRAVRQQMLERMRATRLARKSAKAAARREHVADADAAATHASAAAAAAADDAAGAGASAWRVFNLHARVEDALSSMGFATPTEVQVGSCPELFSMVFVACWNPMWDHLEARESL